MYKASMSQKIVKKKAAYPTELTEMQRRFCEHLIMNEGRTTRTAAAIEAVYSEKSATQEAAGLIQNPKIQKYLQLWQLSTIRQILINIKTLNLMRLLVNERLKFY